VPSVSPDSSLPARNHRPFASPASVFAARLGKGMTSGAREEREGMIGGPHLAVRGKGLTGGVVAGLLCGNRGRMDAKANCNWF